MRNARGGYVESVWNMQQLYYFSFPSMIGVLISPSFFLMGTLGIKPLKYTVF